MKKIENLVKTGIAPYICIDDSKPFWESIIYIYIYI